MITLDEKIVLIYSEGDMNVCMEYLNRSSSNNKYSHDPKKY